MGLRPSSKHSLDRYPDNDGDYTPTNCRWATWKEQLENKRPADKSYLSNPAWLQRMSLEATERWKRRQQPGVSLQIEEIEGGMSDGL